MRKTQCSVVREEKRGPDGETSTGALVCSTAVATPAVDAASGARLDSVLFAAVAGAAGSEEDTSQQDGVAGRSFTGCGWFGIGQLPGQAAVAAKLCQQAEAAIKGCARSAATTVMAASFVVRVTVPVPL